jgi:hypothetical protein
MVTSTVNAKKISFQLESKESVLEDLVNRFPFHNLRKFNITLKMTQLTNRLEQRDIGLENHLSKDTSKIHSELKQLLFSKKR